MCLCLISGNYSLLPGYNTRLTTVRFSDIISAKEVVCVKRILIAAAAVIILLSGCTVKTGGNKPDGSDVSDRGEHFKVAVDRTYSYISDDGHFLLDIAFFEDGTADFRICDAGAAEEKSWQRVYTAVPTAANGGLVLECKDELCGYSVLCTETEATVTASDGAGGKYTAVNEKGDLLIPIPPGFAPDPECEVTIDKTLADGIRESENLPKGTYLSREMLENITSVDIFETHVNALDGIGGLKNVTDLRIADSTVSDISEIAKLEKLERLSLDKSLVEKIPDFKGLDDLYHVSITNAPLYDISALEDIKNLTELDVSCTRVTSASVLAKLKNLKMLFVNNNCILDFEKYADNKILVSALKEADYDIKLAIEAVDKAKEIAASVVKDGMSDVEKEARLSVYLREHAYYEVVYGFMKPFGYQLLIGGKGVCGHYAEAFCLLGRAAGLDVIMVSSDTHAWNMIKLGDSWYHVDVLWDEDCGEVPQYFNRSTEFMNGISDHVHDKYLYPAAKDMGDLAYLRYFK